MRRFLLDYSDIVETMVDETSGIGLIVIRELEFLDVLTKDKTSIAFRGEKLTQYLTVQEMIDGGILENVYAFNELNQIVFGVSVTVIENFCDASDYVKGLELKYPMKDVVYTTGEENPSYDLRVKLSSTGEIIHLGNNMSFGEIQNVAKTLNNKLNLNTFGYDIFEIRRSLDLKK